MKKGLIFLTLIIILTLVSCSPKKENLTGDVPLPKPFNEKSFVDSLRLIKLNSAMDIVPENLYDLGFDRCILQTEGIRIDNDNFRTNFTSKNNLTDKVALLEENNISYYIEVMSGPGISLDRSNSSLYTDKDNIVFFSQMLREIIESNKNNPKFQGIILNIGVNTLDNDIYYNTLKDISERILKDYKIPLILTLDSHYFESDDVDIPATYFEGLDVGFNVDMSFDGKAYPGDVIFNEEKVSLSKNKILNKLLKIKEFNLKNDARQIFISLQCPWKSGGDILVKDIIEIMQMVDFEFIFSYGNSNDKFDLLLDKNITNILNKY